MFFHRPYEIMAHLAGLSVLVLDCIFHVVYYDHNDSSTYSTNTSSASNNSEREVVSMICELIYVHFHFFPLA